MNVKGLRKLYAKGQADRIAAMRRRVRRGDYETPLKLTIAVERALEDDWGRTYEAEQIAREGGGTDET